MRVYPYGVTNYGSTNGQAFPNIVLWDDFMPKILTCPTAIYDYSDAEPDGGSSPDGNGTFAYGVASHEVDGTLQLGASVTDETAAVLDADNASDDAIMPPILLAGNTQDITIAAASISGTGTGTLHAWIDFDGNGSFDADPVISQRLRIFCRFQSKAVMLPNKTLAN